VTELLEQLRSALADHYDVQRELGRGGMSTVFLARDRKHERDVALKLLRPDLASAVGSDRFLREIKLTAGMNHPHILPLLDSGAIDGLVWYAMPYVTGGSLRTRLTRHGPLELGEAIRVAAQVASALDYAHRRGIVHRDVKPENILFSEGHAVVADFGVARAVTVVERQTLTRSGFPVGTLGYMSPEQAAGRTDLDERTDVYGLGCVVYEMLVGETPAGWPLPEDSRLGHFHEIPDAHRARLDALPGRVEAAIAASLAFRPAERFPTAGAFVAALEAALEGREPIADSQARAILARAAGDERAGAGEDAREALAEIEEGRALTIGSVEQAAAEVGIEPERVRAAARELGIGTRGEGTGGKPASAVGPTAAARAPAAGAGSGAFPRSVSAGSHVPRPLAPDVDYAKSKLRASRVLPVKVSEPTLVRLVAEIEDALDLIGHASIVGGTLTWSPAGQGTEGRQLVVTVRPSGEATEVHLEERFEMTGWKQWAPGWGVAGGALIGAAFGASLGVGDPAVGILAVPGAVAGAWLTIKGVENTFVQSRSPQLQRLLDRLTGALQRGGEEE